MKKQLPKIAIKYSEENWPEIKKAVDLLRSKGFSVERRKYVDSIDEREFIGNFNDNPSLSNQCFNYFYSLGGEDDEYTILTMPADFEKLKSYFEEEPKESQNSPKLEAKKWYYGEFNGSPVFSLYMGDNYGWGFYKENGAFIWGSIVIMSKPSSWQPADMTKVKELLIKEAERRGFKKGVRFKRDSFNTNRYNGSLTSDPFDFVINDHYFGFNTYSIFEFETGKWATIIEESETDKLKSEIADLKSQLESIASLPGIIEIVKKKITE